MLGLPSDEGVAIALSELDPVTFETITDPEVIGVWKDMGNSEGELTREDEAKELTEKFYELLPEITENEFIYRYRDTLPSKEKEI